MTSADFERVDSISAFAEYATAMLRVSVSAFLSAIELLRLSEESAGWHALRLCEGRVWVGEFGKGVIAAATFHALRKASGRATRPRTVRSIDDIMSVIGSLTAGVGSCSGGIGWLNHEIAELGVPMLELVDSYAVPNDFIPFAGLGLRMDDLASRLGVTVQTWDVDGLGPARGLMFRSRSLRTNLLEELEMAVRHQGASAERSYRAVETRWNVRCDFARFFSP